MKKRIHCIEPFNKEFCEVLILGTIPSEESLKQNKYYANPKNIFWDIMTRVLESKKDFFELFDHGSISKGYELLRANKIGIWDVIESCERKGSSDSEIRDEIVNDFSVFFENHQQIKIVIFNGKKAFKFFKKGNSLNNFRDIEFRQINSTSSLNPNNAFMILNEWKEAVKSM